MRATYYEQSGGTEVLCYGEVPDPVPGPGDVVVQVAATALNRLDVLQRNGWFQMPGFSYPHIAGMDLAGIVAEVGSAVSNVSPGDRVVVDPSLAGVARNSSFFGRGGAAGEPAVIGGTVDGGYAEMCLVPSSHVHPVPDDMSLEHAATFPTSYVTAAHAMFRVGDLRGGEVVMVHAAGSGMGVASIQLAVRSGATVLATAGTDEKCQRAFALGASHVLNNRTGDVAAWAWEVTSGSGVDMVMDFVGAALFGPSLLSLAPGGRLVNCGNASGDEATIPSLGQMFHSGFSILGSDAYRSEEFGEVWQEFCSGSVGVEIDSVDHLPEAGVAQERMLSGDFFGKILLTP